MISLGYAIVPINGIYLVASMARSCKANGNIWFTQNYLMPTVEHKATQILANTSHQAQEPPRRSFRTKATIHTPFSNLHVASHLFICQRIDQVCEHFFC